MKVQVGTLALEIEVFRRLVIVRLPQGYEGTAQVFVGVGGDPTSLVVKNDNITVGDGLSNENCRDVDGDGVGECDDGNAGGTYRG